MTGITVEAARPAPAQLSLRYWLNGSLSAILIPQAGPPRRTDGLWRHTCFEAFVRAGASPDYMELNFSPSTQWAAYRFADYRTGMSPVEEIGPRVAARAIDGNLLNVDVSVGLPSAMAFQPWHLALSAVIEEVGGRLSLWALAHPRGKPDFHHEDGFALNL